MPITLYDAFVPSSLQMIAVARDLVDKAEAFCAEKGIAPADIIEARLADDMLPFAFQIKAVRIHSLGAIEGARTGEFQPDRSPWPSTFAGLRDLLDEAKAGVGAVSADEMESFVGKDIRFVVPDVLELPFTAENFLLSFSQPNFYFHLTTAYDILRNRGAEVTKRDFLGAMRIKMPA